MKKQKKGKKFSRKADQRKAFLKSLIQSLVLKEKIQTTQVRAKEIRSRTEKLITLAKKGDLAAIRGIGRFLDKKSTKKLIEKIAPRYKERQGGYTRIYKLAPRRSDGAKRAIIELIKEK